MKSLILGLALAGAASAASAASSEIPYNPELTGRTVQCSDFRHNADGSWTALHSLPIQRENEFTTIAADTTFERGGPKTVGMDVWGMLTVACPR